MSNKQPDKSKPKVTSKPDELIKKDTAELSEEELKRVTGGDFNITRQTDKSSPTF